MHVPAGNDRGLIPEAQRKPHEMLRIFTDRILGGTATPSRGLYRGRGCCKVLGGGNSVSGPDFQAAATAHEHQKMGRCSPGPPQTTQGRYGCVGSAWKFGGLVWRLESPRGVMGSRRRNLRSSDADVWFVRPKIVWMAVDNT